MEEKTGSGIVLAASQTRKHARTIARVLSVGENRLTKRGVPIPFDVKPGDWVIVTRYHGDVYLAKLENGEVAEVEILDQEQVLSQIDSPMEENLMEFTEMSLREGMEAALRDVL